MELWRIPRLWPGATVVCIGGGPSLSREQVDYAGSHLAPRAIAVNDAYRLAPWAGVLYAADAKWWRWHDGAPDFKGERVTAARGADKEAVVRDFGLRAVHTLQTVDTPQGGRHPARGLSLAPDTLVEGQNSGYQAVNLAVQMGARRILLLGYDMHADSSGRRHWFGEHPKAQPAAPNERFTGWCANFATMLPDLEKAGVEVLNCTPGSALTCFPFVPLEMALQ